MPVVIHGRGVRPTGDEPPSPPAELITDGGFLNGLTELMGLYRDTDCQ